MPLAPRTTLQYLRIRRRLARDYDAIGLEDLLRGSGTARHQARPRGRGHAPSPGILRGIRLAEALAPRLGLRPDTCLFRALTRYRLLRRAGYAATFCMGVHPDDANVGHAWVEVDGRGVLEPIPHALMTTFRFP